MRRWGDRIDSISFNFFRAVFTRLVIENPHPPAAESMLLGSRRKPLPLKSKVQVNYVLNIPTVQRKCRGLPVCLSNHLSIHRYVYLSICLSVCLPTYLPPCHPPLPTYMYLSICWQTNYRRKISDYENN